MIEYVGGYIKTTAEVNNELNSGSGMFAGRKMDVQKERTTLERFWEMGYQLTGRESNVKTMEKQYFLRGLVKLFAADKRNPDYVRTEIQKAIEENPEVKRAFDEMADHADSVSTVEIMAFRSKVEYSMQQRIYERVQNKIANCDHELLDPNLPETEKLILLLPAMRLCMGNNFSEKAYEYYIQLKQLKAESFESDWVGQKYRDKWEEWKEDSAYYGDWINKNVDQYVIRDWYQQKFLVSSVGKHKLPFEVISLIDKKPVNEGVRILEKLYNEPKFWDSDNKLNWDQLINALESDDPIRQMEYLYYEKNISVAGGLKKDLFCNDPTMPEWNVLTQREGNIDDVEWDVVKTVAVDIFDAMKAGDDTKRGYLVKFFDQCMNTADAKSEAGRQNIRKRVTATIDYLQELKAKHDKSTNDTEKELIEKQIKGALDTIAIGGSACADRTIVFLTKLETDIKLLENPKYLPNIMVQMYKDAAIKDYLTDPKKAENIEDFLRRRIELFLPLGLGASKEKGEMLYEGIAEAMPVEEALKKLSPAFTADNLVDFTARQDTFKLTYESEMENDDSVSEARSDFLEADDELTDAKNAQAPQDEIDRLQAQVTAAETRRVEAEHKFYSDKARELFQEAGFIEG